MRAGPIIGTDDTTVTLVTPDDLPPLDPLDPKSARSREVIAAAHAEARKSITARIWAYRGITVPINVFDFTVSRHRDGPEIFLDGFTGKLMKDSFGQALTYLRNQFDPLLVYLDDGLMPIDNNETWKESHPEAVRVYRAEERAARADAKVTKRARRRAGRK